MWIFFAVVAGSLVCFWGYWSVVSWINPERFQVFVERHSTEPRERWFGFLVPRKSPQLLFPVGALIAFIYFVLIIILR